MNCSVERKSAIRKKPVRARRRDRPGRPRLYPGDRHPVTCRLPLEIIDALRTEAFLGLTANVSTALVEALRRARPDLPWPESIETKSR